MSFSIATFNVKNLLDPRDETERALLPRKLDAIAQKLEACDADVVGLQEIGTLALAREIVSRLPRSGYGEPVVGTPDARGIRCALLSRLPVLDARVHTADSLGFPVFFSGDPPPFGSHIPLRRGVVHARVALGAGEELHVLVAHFKSSLPVALRDATGSARLPSTPLARAEGRLRSLVWRAAEALYARSLVDEILAHDSRAHVVVVGDLNDVPASAVVRALQSDGDGALFDCTEGLDPSVRFSLRSGCPAVQIDHILATADARARLAGVRFLNGDLRDHGAFDPEAPERGEPFSVDSDHAPLVATFT